MSTIPLSKSEKAYIQSSLEAHFPLRSDGRALYDYRTIALETGVAPLANGSARLNIGRANNEPAGGTEILAATKLEVEDIQTGDGVEGGRVTCSVSWCAHIHRLRAHPLMARARRKASSPSAYPHLSTAALDDLQYDYTVLLQGILAHPSLRPTNLGILPRRKAWLLALDLVVLSDSGNIYDALFMAARAALWDTKVPRTRSVEYRANAAKGSGSGDMDVDEEKQSGFDTRQDRTATDFELEDYWDEGEPLGGREKWPVCITLNLVRPRSCSVQASH
ncbi:hypothetical protein EWM64_g7920 [Hericium alpestre]|uniref:Ribosomal RNA-processing protein 42 n=1 Tax=Hericium alpestre TaxID=135208 RepID=A0A4Y9ZQI6_9AGAM|nr:hypothetical protein EWM64_g7920 [Hericium alpestre]